MRVKARSVGVITVILLSGLAGFFVFESEHVSAYASHDPILIVGNENFTTANGVTGGNGTEADPYIIDGWLINTTWNHSIEIRNTTAHFVIQNVSIRSANNDYVRIYNATNGTITNIRSYDQNMRIRILYSSYIQLINNNLSNSWTYVDLDYSSNCTLKNNDCLDKTYSLALTLSHSLKNTIYNNDIEIGNSGIVLLHSNNNIIYENRITGFNMYGPSGIYLYNSHDNNITHNYITNCREGIFLQQSTNVTLIDNLVEWNMDGIILEVHCDDAVVINNDVFVNSWGISISQSNRLLFLGNNVSDNYGIGAAISSNNSTIENNTAHSNNFDGLRLGVSNSSVKNNIVIRNDEGIYLGGSKYVNVESNYIKDNAVGINLDASENITVTGNELYTNNDRGIIIETQSKGNIVINNIITNSDYGILLDSCSFNYVSNNEITGCNDAGMRLWEASENTIYQNRLQNNDNDIAVEYLSSNNQIISNDCLYSKDSGIVIASSTGIELLGNLIKNNENQCILILESPQITMKYNLLYESGLIINSIYPDQWCSHDIDTTNLVNDKPLYYWTNRSDESVPGGAGQVILVQCENVTVENQQIEKTVNALTLYSSTRCSIKNNEFSTNIWDGIQLLYSNENLIEGSKMNSNSNNGLYLYQSKYNEINNNEMKSNDEYGIRLYNADYNNISNNDCSDNSYYGAFTYQSHLNKIYNNTLNNNFYYGVRLLHSDGNHLYNNIINSNGRIGITCANAEYNKIYENQISSNNEYGIYIHSEGRDRVFNNTISSNSISGILLSSTNYNRIYGNIISFNGNGLDISYASTNSIYHNSFISNVNQTVFKGEDENAWNLAYPLGGNYWSDYIGNDYYQGPFQDIQGWDGIGDDEKDLGKNNTDLFPLMKPWGDPPFAPRELKVTSGCGFIHLRWLYPAETGSFPVMNFTIYRGSTADNLTFYISVGTTQEFNDTDVENGVEYFYQALSNHQIGDSPGTPVLSAVPGLPPSAPQDLVATESNDYIALLWEEPEFDGCMGVTHYLVYKGFASGSLQQFAKVVNTEFFIDENVTEGIFYYYQVSAVNGIGEGTRSEEASYIIAALPLEPQNVTTVVGDRYVKLTWEPPLSDGGMPIEDYYVYRNNTDGLYEAFVKVDEDVFTFIDTDVDNGIKYGYKVRAKNKLGKGPLSPVVYATPDKPPLTTNEAPRAQISAFNTTGPPPLNVSFEGSGIDKDGTIKSYIWDFDDGNKSYEKNPKHTFFNYGTYYVRLTVIDDEGASGQAMITIVVTSDEKPPDGKEEKKEDLKEASSAWFIAPVAAIIICIIILILLLFMWLKVKEEKPEVVERKRIVREPIAYRRLKRLRSIEEEEFYEQELEE